MSSESSAPTKISDETFYWLIRYEAKAGNNVEVKRIAELLDIKHNAAYMQLLRAKKRLEDHGVKFETSEVGGAGDGGNGEEIQKRKGRPPKKRGAVEDEEGLDGMLNPKKKVKAEKVKAEDVGE